MESAKYFTRVQRERKNELETAKENNHYCHHFLSPFLLTALCHLVISCSYSRRYSRGQCWSHGNGKLLQLNIKNVVLFCLGLLEDRIPASLLQKYRGKHKSCAAPRTAYKSADLALRSHGVEHSDHSLAQSIQQHSLFLGVTSFSGHQYSNCRQEITVQFNLIQFNLHSAFYNKSVCRCFTEAETKSLHPQVSTAARKKRFLNRKKPWTGPSRNHLV